MPEPRQVSAEDGVQFVLDVVEVAGRRGGERSPELLPPRVAEELQLWDRLEMLDEQPETGRPPLVVSLLVVQPIAQLEQPDHGGMW